MTNRRAFLRISCSTFAISTGMVDAQATMLSEKDPQAVALGYVALATRADKTKFPKYAQGQHCAACQLYQGATSAPTAPCAIFAGKQVAGPGWCSAYTPRPG
jgi:hypothetical protein